MQRTQIHICTVLAEMELPDEQGQPRAFSIGYYKTDGTRGSKPAVKKGGLAGVGGSRAGLEGRSAFRYKVKETGTVQLDQFGDKPEEKKKAELDLMTNINEMLAGVENTDKVFVSKFAVDSAGIKLPGWEIVPIENKMSDSAYDSVNTQANIAHTSSHGIDPSLAGIDTGGKFGGSGSEKRTSFQRHIALRTPQKRKILRQTIQPAHNIMGFNPLHRFGFVDVDITTIAENPKGQEKSANMAH